MKDLFATNGVQTTAASHMLEGFVPRYESTVSAKLWDAGAGMLGKLNLDQFAMGSSNETSYFGNVISPWKRNDGGNAALAPGGSSGGSSSAIAARLCPAATGTDTGGLDPPARGFRRDLRDQADLRPLLALGHRGLRELARSGGADGARRQRLRDHAREYGGLRSEGRDEPEPARAQLGSGFVG